MMTGLVSFIIPGYNAGEYITETLESVKSQLYANWEIIVVDDGSSDNTVVKVLDLAIPGLTILKQQNQGVSIARNNGMAVAKGEFITFLDADDILTPDFLDVRMAIMKADSSIAFVGGLIKSFPGNSILKKAAGENAEREILFFDNSYSTVPSNYLFRSSTLKDNNITFNPRLSSTADRFFILQVANFGKGRSIESEKGKLLYRVSSNSMSHRVSPRLMNDNRLFLTEIKKAGLLPNNKRKIFLSNYYFSIGLGFFKTGMFPSFIHSFFKSFINHPIYFFKKILQRMRIS